MIAPPPQPQTPTITQANKEYLSIGQRVGEVIGIAAMLVVIAFFINHLRLDTGFFTSAFGPLEMLCLFVPLVLSLTGPIARVVTGRRNPARPFDIATNALLALGSLWLLIVFPFDFTRLADALPSNLQFLLGWVTDWMGKVVLILQVVVGAAMVAITMRLYYVVSFRNSR